MNKSRGLWQNKINFEIESLQILEFYKIGTSRKRGTTKTRKKYIYLIFKILLFYKKYRM